MAFAGHGYSGSHKKKESCGKIPTARKYGAEGKGGKKHNPTEVALCKKLVLLLAMSNEDVVAELNEILRLINADLEVPADSRGPDGQEWGAVERNAPGECLPSRLPQCHVDVCCWICCLDLHPCFRGALIRIFAECN